MKHNSYGRPEQARHLLHSWKGSFAPGHRERNLEMHARYLAGETFADLGVAYGINNTSAEVAILKIERCLRTLAHLPGDYTACHASLRERRK